MLPHLQDVTTVELVLLACQLKIIRVVLHCIIIINLILFDRQITAV